MKIPLSLIKPSPRPVRTTWDEAKLNELADSIQQQGLIVPVKVRQAGDGYELVYGHRRTEAARRVGLQEIEAIVEGVDDTAALVQALIENLQREDMQPLDKARALKALKDETGWSLGEIERQGIISDANASRYLSLLNEPPSVQRLISAGNTSGGMPSGTVGVQHVESVRISGLDLPSREGVLNKAAAESLTQTQTRRVAESVAAAPSEQAKRFLLEQQYSPTTHDPELIRSRAQQYGVSDPLYSEPKAQQASVAVSVAAHAFIEATKRWDVLLTETRKMIQAGQVAPEGKQFIAHRVRQTIKSLETFLEELEG